MQTTNRYFYVGASRYDFRSEKGEQLRGAKIVLIPLEMAKRDNVTGYQVEILNADYDLFDKVRGLQVMKPYEFLLDIDMTGKNPRVRVLAVNGEVKAA